MKISNIVLATLRATTLCAAGLVLCCSPAVAVVRSGTPGTQALDAVPVISAGGFSSARTSNATGPGANVHVLLVPPMHLVSIAIVSRQGTTLSITSASMSGPLGAAVALNPVITSRTEPFGQNAQYFEPNEAYILPDTPLKPGATYHGSISGTNDGKPFSLKFSFTTGAEN